MLGSAWVNTNPDCLFSLSIYHQLYILGATRASLIDDIGCNNHLLSG